MRFGPVGILSCIFARGTSTVARAQDAPRTQLSVSAVGVQYDLSGVGSAPGVAVRATRALSPSVALESGGLFARPDQQFGGSTFFIPEAQLRYRWSAGRLSPYVGGGGGAALTRSSFHTDWDPTLSVSAGPGVRLTEYLDAFGELRLRGVSWRFTGSTADWGFGLAWRLPGM